MTLLCAVPRMWGTDIECWLRVHFHGRCWRGADEQPMRLRAEGRTWKLTETSGKGADMHIGKSKLSWRVELAESELQLSMWSHDWVGVETITCMCVYPNESHGQSEERRKVMASK